MTRSRKSQNNNSGKQTRLVKVFVCLLVLGGFGWGMYFAGQAQLFQSESKVELKAEQVVVIKKPVASKPNRAFGAVLAETRNEKADSFNYTFFEILGDSEMNRFVDLNGNIVEKNVPVKVALKSKKAKPIHVEAVKIAAVSEKVVQAKVKTPTPPAKLKKPQLSPVPSEKRVDSGKKKPVSKSPAPVIKATKPELKNNEWVLSSLSQLEEKSENFWVQVASFKKLDRAQGLEEKLKLNGFFPFIRQIEIKGKGQWYRVYLGKYPSREIASRYAEMARKKLKLSPVVLKAS